MIGENAALIDVIKEIENNHLQVALVGREGQLVGTVTDGDIRRGILKGLSLDIPVRQVMNPSPITAQAGISDEDARALMQKHSIAQLPLLDSDRKVTDVKILSEVTQAPNLDNWVVLMAGGVGTRLKPLTDDTPKPLIKVGDRPILETILRGFISSGFSKFYISVNFKAELIEEYFGDGAPWNVEIRYLRERERLGTAGSLSLIPTLPSDPIFVMNGDLLTTIDFRQMLNYHTEKDAPATIAVREHQVNIPYGVVEYCDDRLIEIVEKPSKQYFVNAGIYIINPTELKTITSGKRFDMPELFDSIIESGGKPAVFPIREYWIDVGRLKDLKTASEDFDNVFG